MAIKKKTVRRTAAPRKRVAAKRATNKIQQTWNDTVAALRSGEVRRVLDREGRKGLRQLEARFADLQSRARQERKQLSKRVDAAVQGALASFNIPSRREVQELGRKVSDLSRKVDALKR